MCNHKLSLLLLLMPIAGLAGPPTFLLLVPIAGLSDESIRFFPCCLAGCFLFFLAFAFTGTIVCSLHKGMGSGWFESLLDLQICRNNLVSWSPHVTLLVHNRCPNITLFSRTRRRSAYQYIKKKTNITFRILQILIWHLFPLSQLQIPNFDYKEKECT